jgi:hypothetical protein
MRLLKYAVPLAVFAGGLILTTTTGFATMEIAKKEKKGCVVCHVKAGSKDLNDAGKYYKEKKSLVGYKAKEKK